MCVFIQYVRTYVSMPVYGGVCMHGYTYVHVNLNF